MHIDHLDHLVLTVRDIEASAAFYVSVLGMQRISFNEGRTALRFGNEKINLHQSGHEFEPKAGTPTEGSGDLCFIVRDEIADVITQLHGLGVPIVEGPVPRSGALGPMTSVYVRDPDQNLIELSRYEADVPRS